jgi:hypothetical protein
MKAELSNSNVQIPISKQYQILQIPNGTALTRVDTFDIRKLFRISIFERKTD